MDTERYEGGYYRRVQRLLDRDWMEGPANIGSAKGTNKDPTSYDGITKTIDFRLIDF